ncbi:hypothetical protein [Paenibacillus spongiae]|uniref:DUF2628 domain-containing protein n=1 Tax=Paenibacillus spongiae TaxID=2909671 RepID=A0ABY5SB99_9BACL|nr:hypothetical protein [Paenibacillus spongiae]UVI31231.1 hypothetical protein L1F29_05140 [Paenibacillus spongiae]
MSQFARVKINGFDFDSTAPVQGMVYDERKEEAKREMMHSAIRTFIAIDVVLIGWWLCFWWYDGGFHLAYVLFNKLAPGFLNMVMTGQL